MQWTTLGNWIVAIVVGVLASTITQVATSRRDRKTATYLAVRIAITLEAFAIACADLIHENDRAQRSDDDEGPRESLPELAVYPGDENWQTLDVSLANRALAFRNDLTVSHNTMYADWQTGDGPQSDLCDDEAAKRGIQAWDLASDLRSRYKIATYSPGYAIRDHLQKHIDDARATKEAQYAANRSLIAEMFPEQAGTESR